ncbi:MAG: hypothetical protein H8E57_09810 [Candidatus Cloacimonetes bacterium]|nr:hypothetical protein [Candidatus Cloacimonadota bacterium]
MYKETEFVEGDEDLHKLTIKFPDAYTKTFYRRLFKGYLDGSMPSITHLIQIDYNTNKENSALAAYGIIENDEKTMRICYDKLVSELIEIKSSNIGNGNWKIIEDGEFAFTMESNNEDFPKITVGIDIGSILGVKLKFLIHEN